MSSRSAHLRHHGYEAPGAGQFSTRVEFSPEDRGLSLKQFGHNSLDEPQGQVAGPERRGPQGSADHRVERRPHQGTRNIIFAGVHCKLTELASSYPAWL